MYYITRKDINKKTRIIYSAFFRKNKENNVNLISKNEQKKIINNCIIKACGFESLQEYSLNTRYIKDINAMTPINQLNYFNLDKIEEKIIENIIEVYPFLKNKINKKRFLFKDIYKNRIRRLKYPSNRKSNFWKKDFVDSIEALINHNQGTIATLSENEIEQFIQNTISYVSVGYMFDLDSFIYYFNNKYPDINLSFLNSMESSMDLNPIIKGLMSLDDQSLNLFKNEISDFNRVDIYTLINKKTNNLYNKEFLYFIEVFKDSFWVKNKWVVNKENKKNFKEKIIDKYRNYDKI